MITLSHQAMSIQVAPQSAVVSYIYRFLSSFRTTIVLLVTYALLLAAATIIEKVYGTSVAKEAIYHSPVFFVLQLLLIANFFLYTGHHHYWDGRRWGFLLTHLAFVVIIAGASITHFTGKEGILHIREGETTNSMILMDGDITHTVTLPFSVRLDDFVLKRYPGSDTPSSYESFLTIFHEGSSRQAHIYMNNVFDIAGYRLFQSSFGRDEQSSILSVNYDLPGRRVTYTGYVILLAGLLFSVFGRHSRIRVLFKQLREIQSGKSLLLLGLFSLLSFSVSASNHEQYNDLFKRYTVNQSHAALFGKLSIQSSNGRIMPINTYALEILRKLHKSDRFGELSPEQFLLSLFLTPNVWMGIPLITIDNENLAGYYGLSMPYCAFAEVIDSTGKYKLRTDLEKVYRKTPPERDAFDKDILQLNEQVNLMDMLLSRKAFRLFPLPADSTHTWYSPGDDLSVFSGKDSIFVSHIFDRYLDEVASSLKSGDWKIPNEVAARIATFQQVKSNGVGLSPKRVEAEITYNKLNIFRHCKIGYLLIGGMALFFSVWSLFGHDRGKTVKTFLSILMTAIFCFHTYGIALRWYISGHAPWSNSYETMVYVAGITLFAGLLFIRKSYLVFSLAALFSGIILFVSELGWMDPHITPLVPVLKSPWLMIHVAVIVASYGFFGLSFLIGVTNLFLLSSGRGKHTAKVQELSILNEISMWIGLVLMVGGTFIGAVWANVSWGRYWGWDPKETWALITIVVYAITTHIHLLKVRYALWLFNFLSVFSISTVLMTFFGVSYFLSGIHSYGHSGDISGSIIWLVVAFASLSIVGQYSYIKAKKTLSI